MKFMKPINLSFISIFSVLTLFQLADLPLAFGQAQSEGSQVLSLNDCLRIAMEKNHSRPASQFAVAIAEAQHRQALAAYWPQINANGGV
jgi:outer membrane protein TolC